MTAFVLITNRYQSDVYLQASANAVPLDALVNEFYTLPAGFGQLLIRSVGGNVEQLSGAYVAPAPAYDGLSFYLADAAGATMDTLAAERFVHSGTSSTRPTLQVVKELVGQRRLMRQSDRLYITAPILAGAGVTGVVVCRLMGLRIQTQ